MGRRRLLGGTAMALAAGALGAFAATGFGGGDEPAHTPAVNAGKVEFEVAREATARTTQTAVRRARRRLPVVTHLISSNAIAAPADSSTFTAARCPDGTGLPIGGGVITNGAADLAADVLSRFNPNTFRAPRNRYFIGVRNDSAAEQTFRATLICGKRMTVR